MDPNLTIVLVVKNLGQYTKRFVDFYTLGSTCPYRILVADGGNDDEIQEYLIGLESVFPDVITYVRFPFDSSLTEFHQKLYRITDHIKTPLCVFMSPDDFLSLDGLEKSIQFLYENPEYCSTRGELKQMTLGGNRVYGQVDLGVNIYDQFRDPIISERSSERTHQQMVEFHGNWHNVTRTKTLKCVFGLLSIANPKNMRFTEQIQGTLVATLGKVNRASHEFLLMQANPSQKDPTRVNDFPSQKEWVESKGWAGDFSRMTEAICSAISYLDDITFDEAEEIYTQAYGLKVPATKNLVTAKINQNRSSGYNSSRIKEMSEFIRSLNLDKPDEIKEPIRYPNKSGYKEIINFLSKKKVRLENFTLVVPVRERQENLSRIFKYFEILDCRKIVFDSSELIYKDAIPEGFEYFHCGPTEYYDLWINILNEVKTDLYLDCSDDDFVSIVGLKSCVDFMLNNPDFTWCDGNVGNYLGDGVFRNNHGHEICNSYKVRVSESYVVNNINERLLHVFHNQWNAPNHSVIRRSHAIKCFDLVSKNPSIKPIRYFDKILLFGLALQGNYKTLPVQLNYRSAVPGIFYKKIKIEESMRFDLPYETMLTQEKIEVLENFYFDLTGELPPSGFIMKLFSELQTITRYTVKSNVMSPLLDKIYEGERNTIIELFNR